MLESLRARLARGSKVKLLYAGEEHAAALVGPCLAVIARREPGPNIFQEAPRWVDGLLEAYPHKGGVIVIVQANAPPPSDASRSRIDRAYSEYGRGVVAGAMVIEGRGFVAASIRSVLSLMMLTSKYSYPIKTFSNVDDGAAFLANKLPDASAAPAPFIASGVEELRAAYEGEMGAFTAGPSRANI
ncbi:MAG TPA: hypothetical protein VFS43_11760 [Polyangiaceae bacterium]|nr:hypothetical protein [Polyangiaceae bacterium]